MGIFLGDSGHLEHYSSGLNDGYPELGVTFTGSHTYFSWLLGHRFVRKHSDPELTATLYASGHRFTSSFYLSRRDPVRLEDLETILSELHGDSARFGAGHSASVLLSELSSFGHQHSY